MIRSAGLIIAAFVFVVASGCARTEVKEEEFSGFLADYSSFDELEAGDGYQIVGWVRPNIEGKYGAVILNPVRIHPPRQTFERVDEETVAAMLAYLNRRLREEVGKQIEIVSEPGPGVLEFSAAITTAEVGFRPLKWYQYTPITAAVTMVGEATGLRDEGVQLIAESELVDTRTGLRVAAAARLGSGKVGTDERVELDNLEEILDEWAVSAGLWVSKNL